MRLRSALDPNHSLEIPHTGTINGLYLIQYRPMQAWWACPHIWSPSQLYYLKLPCIFLHFCSLLRRSLGHGMYRNQTWNYRKNSAALSIKREGMTVLTDCSRSNAAAKAQEAINLFTSAYADYRKYAWGHDSLAPINKTFIDGELYPSTHRLYNSYCIHQDRNGWGATIVDAMSTMKIMGLEVCMYPPSLEPSSAFLLL
jgi:hypothetical protein